MQKTIEAIYENGVLRPTEPLDWLKEKGRVTLTLSAPDVPGPLRDFVGGISDEDAAIMRKVIEDEFEQVNPDDWK
jgi:predicted DNA-binding antitoxin AbrB/MazE fold protein